MSWISFLANVSFLFFIVEIYRMSESVRKIWAALISEGGLAKNGVDLQTAIDRYEAFCFTMMRRRSSMISLIRSLTDCRW